MNQITKRETYSGEILTLDINKIFVFGSNTQGRHGKGAAKVALDRFGAIYGQARGHQGQSYGICTKDLTKRIHPSVSQLDIKGEIFSLYNYASINPHLKFYIAYSGNGVNLNAYTPQDMADMFSSWNHIAPIPSNIIFEQAFNELITF